MKNEGEILIDKNHLLIPQSFYQQMFVELAKCFYQLIVYLNI